MPEQKYEFSRNFNQPAQKVWRFITESDKLSRWLLPNDFSLDGNGEFRMWTQPGDAWDGVLHGSINEYEVGKSLSYDLTTSLSPEKSTLDWSVDQGATATCLSLSHEGSEQLVETIYKAINGTQVSGHLRQNQNYSQNTPVQSSINIQQGPNKTLLENLRNDILSSPLDVEDKVAQAATKYPNFVEHIVCIAVEAFPERAASILEAVKGKGHYQKLLGLTLFLLLFKGAIEDAQAANIDQESQHQDELDDGIIDISLGEGETDADLELDKLVVKARQEALNGQFRLAAGMALVVLIVATSDKAIAAEILHFLNDDRELATLVAEADLDLDGMSETVSQGLLAVIPDMSQGSILTQSGVFQPGDLAPFSFTPDLVMTQRSAEANKILATKKNRFDPHVDEGGADVTANVEDETFEDDAYLEFEDEMIWADESDFQEELAFYEEWFAEVFFGDDIPEEGDEIYEGPAAELEDEEGGLYEDIDEDEYLYDEPEDTSEDILEMVFNFVEFVEDYSGHHVQAVIMAESGLDLVFEEDDIVDILAEYEETPYELLFVDSEENFEDRDLSQFSEIESYTTTDHVDDMIDDRITV